MSTPSRISFGAAVIHVLLLRPFLKLFCGVNVAGRENLDRLNQVVIIANHNSHLDVLLLYLLLPLGRIRDSHPVADLPYFAKSRLVLRLVDYLFKPIWISRGRPHPEGDPFNDIKSAVEAGRNVIIFPEGTRGKPGEMEHFRSGIGRLMSQYPNLPIVPVFLTGPERALPKTSALLLPVWNNIIVGPPQKCLGGHRGITHELESVLADLSRSESARRHKRRSQAVRTPRNIAFLGIDGSGKSTASEMTARRLSETHRVCLVSDELRVYEQGQRRDLQPLPSEQLRRWIGAHAKTAESLKHYKIPKLAELLLRDRLLQEARRWYAPDLVVMDGSPLLNLLAWSVLYRPEELDETTCSKTLGILSGLTKNVTMKDSIFVRFPELAYLKRLGLAHLTLPEVVILIDVSSATACRRIEARGQPRQVHETEEKLEHLRQAYIKVCQVVRTDWSVPTMIVDGSRSRESIVDRGFDFAQASLAAR